MDKASHNAIGKDYRLWHTTCAVIERGVAGFVIILAWIIDSFRTYAAIGVYYSRRDILPRRKEAVAILGSLLQGLER